MALPAEAGGGGWGGGGGGGGGGSVGGGGRGSAVRVERLELLSFVFSVVSGGLEIERRELLMRFS
jgi:hypothetical protein